MAMAGPGQETMDAKPVSTLCMACEDARCDFKAMELLRRPVGREDVLIDMRFCGVCHTDLHFSASHVGGMLKTRYPCVPGHELVGVVEHVGAGVTKFAVGDHIGVGCMVDSCLKCSECKRGQEQMCMWQVSTYQGKDMNGRAATYPKGGYTLGGYTTKMVVHEHFGVKIPQDYPLEAAGPVMCAGVTMFDPLRRHGATKGTRVGVIGMGGLGIMGLRLAFALGCEVTAISRSEQKRQLTRGLTRTMEGGEPVSPEAAAVPASPTSGRSEQTRSREAGAAEFLLSTDPAQMQKAKGTFDLILNTVPAHHDYAAYKPLLAPKGKLVLLGLAPELPAALVAGKVNKRCSIIGSGIGGIPRTQEVIDFCHAHDIVPELKVFPCSELNEVFEALDQANEKGLRYVMDIQGTLKPGTTCPKGAPQLTPMKPIGTCAILAECCKLCWLPRYGCCCCKCC